MQCRHCWDEKRAGEQYSFKNKQKATESERRKYANRVSREIELEPQRGQKSHTIGSIWGGVRALVPSPSSWARFKD